MKVFAFVFLLTAAPAFAQVTADTANPLEGKADAIEAGHALVRQDELRRLPCL
jgi:hypothetical protein